MSMRKVIVAGNWKMNGSQLLTKQIIIGTIARLWDQKLDEKHEVVFIPPFIYIPLAHTLTEDSDWKIGAQNMYFQDKGAFTGEISPNMLKEFGVEYVVIGHSERRHIFGEDNELIAKKVKKATEEGLIPILCVGETLEERESGKTWDVIREQLVSALDQFEKLPEIVIAYEPVWAIGTGKAATKEDAEEVFITGGAHLYNKFLQDTDRLYLTLIKGEFDGDTYFPDYTQYQWNEIDRIENPADDQNSYATTFLTLERIR